MEEKVQNPKTEVPCSVDMNDRDYLNLSLELEKNMSNNYSIALNEMSNEILFNKIKEMFDMVKKEARDMFELMFQKGWYTLEKTPNLKTEEKINEFNSKLSELI